MFGAQGKRISIIRAVSTLTLGFSQSIDQKVRILFIIAFVLDPYSYVCTFYLFSIYRIYFRLLNVF